MANCSGLIHGASLIHLSGTKLPIQIRKSFSGCRQKYSNAAPLVSRSISGSNQQFRVKQTDFKCFSSWGENNQKLEFEEEFRSEPFWLSLIKEAVWALRSLLVFLAEQPGQLKYIEWPSFQSTLKTASLTLFLVALLIVALSSIDSVLSFLLALLLRKPA